ncbi:GNAT family N-acetyltransferase [Halomonas sp. Bachu 37]|uniref:GNAT family N-acetyltransferase n=1 Tax=Halomonas kashgarensis TaxID=3084920 RepID=UPI003216D0D7
MTLAPDGEEGEAMTLERLDETHQAALVDLESRAGSGMSESQLAMALSDPQATVLGIWREPESGENASLLGYAWLARQPFDAELLALGVAPDARRWGLGRLLLQALVETASRWGSERLLLEVRATNAAAIALYRQGGFSIDGRRKGYYPPVPPQTAREDALLMSRLVSPVVD